MLHTKYTLIAIYCAQRVQVTALHGVLRNYLDNVSNVEWDQMATMSQSIDTDTSHELMAMHYCAATLRDEMRAAGEDGRLGLFDSLIVANIVKLGELRTKRLALSTSALPTRLKTLLIWMIGLLFIGCVHSVSSWTIISYVMFASESD